VPGTTLSGSSVTFDWDAGNGPASTGSMSGQLGRQRQHLRFLNWYQSIGDRGHRADKWGGLRSGVDTAFLRLGLQRLHIYGWDNGRGRGAAPQ